MQPLDTVLNLGLTQMGLTLSSETRNKLLDFVALLDKWNKTYNLTAVRDPQQMITHHILDSLAIRAFLKGPNILDIGTGAGLPGIPLALVCPEYEFTLLDSNAKKTRFVLQALAELGLANVAVVNERVEKYLPRQKFATLVTRAFASLPDMLKSTAHLCADGGEFLAMKGALSESEVAQIPAGFTVLETRELQVPGVEGERRLLRIVASSA